MKGMTVTQVRDDLIIRTMRRLNAENTPVDLYQLSNALGVEYTDVYYWAFGVHNKSRDVRGFVDRYPTRFHVTRSMPDGKKPRILIKLARVSTIAPISELLAVVGKKVNVDNIDIALRTLMRNGRFLDAVALELYTKHVPKLPIIITETRSLAQLIDHDLLLLYDFDQYRRDVMSEPEWTPRLIDDYTLRLVLSTLVGRGEVYAYDENGEALDSDEIDADRKVRISLNPIKK